jgi:hypothetical protein
MNRLRKVFNRHNAWVGLKVFGLLFGVVSVIVGSLGVAVTLFGMLLFQMANLGGTAVKAIVIPIANTGEIGLGVSIGIILAGVVLLRKPLLWGLRQPLHGIKWIGRRFPSGGLLASPVRFYKSIVRARNWFLAKVEYLQNESAKWKALFTTLKLPYSALRMAGFSPQMAVTLLFAGSTVGSAVVVNETILEGRSFSRGDAGVYLAPGDTPVSYVDDPNEEGYNTLRIDLGATPVRAITIENVSIGTVFTGSALPSGTQEAVLINGVPTSQGFTATRLEVGHLIFEKSRCKKLELSDIQAHTLIVKGNASDGQSISPSPGTSRMRAIGGGHHQADELRHSGGTFDRIWIQAPISGTNGRVDKLTLSNLYTKGGPCVLARMNVGTLEITLNEIGEGNGFATKEFTITTSVTAANMEISDNVEVTIAEPATQ